MKTCARCSPQSGDPWQSTGTVLCLADAGQSLDLPSLGVNAELSEPNAAGLVLPQDEFLFQKLGDLFLIDARGRGHYLQVSEAGIDFSC